jgi:hypothetical protein
MPRCIQRLIYVEHTTWCTFDKVMNGRKCLEPVTTILNMLWCHLALLTCLIFFNNWLMMSFMNIWMISWFVTSMTSLFSQKTWRTMSTMYIWFWRSFKRFDFMPNWRSVISINLKWNSWVLSFLEMAFAWIFTRFRPLLIGLL